MEKDKKSSPKKPAVKKTATKKTVTKKKPSVAKSSILVIVESPAKAHTISKFLGRGYKVTASQGHIRDLPQKGLGVNIEQEFEPKYVISKDRKELISTIKKEAKEAKAIYLATDPDREGEAISWHIAKVLDIDESSNCRIEFNEITKQAVTNAIKLPRAINMDRVNAQQTRRILDRLVGYKISPILWKKLRAGLSAGRVQSVALKFICERDREIDNFTPQEYWSIASEFTELKNNEQFEAKLDKIKGKKAEISCEADAAKLSEKAKTQQYHIASVKKGTKQRKAQPPFTTSTMQQEAARKLYFSPANTMRISQQLYEGVDIKGNGTAGLITYIRTDSVRVSQEALDAVRSYIDNKYGASYLPDKPNNYPNRRNAQDAHEAIRPTSMEFTPERVKESLNAEQYKLYELIFNRFVSSQMKPELSDTISADIVGGEFTFRTTGSIVRFDGYRKVYTEGNDNQSEEEPEKKLPELVEGTKCSIGKVTPQQHFTQPPARYTEATLVKTLEEKGIGRPSTYASIISTILERKYIEKENRTLRATSLGYTVNDLMTENFKDIVDEEFTADMETKLDAIEEGSANWKQTLSEFYEPFKITLENAEQSIQNMRIPDEVTDIPCEKCGAMMVIKSGRFGKFLACPNYPQCKNTKPIVENIDVPCPLCGAKIVKKRTKSGKTCYGCEKYPECEFFSWGMPIKEKCEKCGSLMTINYDKNKRPYRQCSNKDCANIEYGKNKKND